VRRRKRGGRAAAVRGRAKKETKERKGRKEGKKGKEGKKERKGKKGKERKKERHHTDRCVAVTTTQLVQPPLRALHIFKRLGQLRRERTGWGAWVVTVGDVWIRRANEWTKEGKEGQTSGPGDTKSDTKEKGKR
jgi:hypothetical protein